MEKKPLVTFPLLLFLLSLITVSILIFPKYFELGMYWKIVPCVYCFMHMGPCLWGKPTASLSHWNKWFSVYLSGEKKFTFLFLCLLLFFFFYYLWKGLRNTSSKSRPSILFLSLKGIWAILHRVCFPRKSLCSFSKWQW